MLSLPNKRIKLARRGAGGLTGGRNVSLTWDDLLIQNRQPEELEPVLAPWSFVVQGRCAPLCLNRFGQWFLLRPEGHVEMLDVLHGRLESVAESHAAFIDLLNTQAWQEAYLHSLAVFALHNAGLVATGLDCYAITPPPYLGGPDPALAEAFPPERVMVMSLAAWQSVCRQVLGGAP